ncbi:MAG: hypothetical protein AMXMBFR83_16460 [Phycisphaerae bacterium]
MKQRLVYGSLMILAIVGVVWLDGALARRALERFGSAEEPAARAGLVACGLPFTLLVVMLAVLATFELARLCEAGGFRPMTWWAAAVCVGMVFLPWIERIQYEVGLSPKLGFVQARMPLGLWWLAGGLLGTCLAALLRKTTDKALPNMALTLFLILYLGLLGSFAVRIRCMDPGPGGAALVVYFILTVKSSDIGAYFTGRAIGRHKLIPWLSPGKTIEGAVGALVLAGVVGLAGMLVWRGFQGWGPPPLSLSQALFFGIVMAIFGHLGDLAESALKRDVGMKDSGAVVPSFGGLLDILDSPLFAAPAAWCLLNFWAPVR